LLLLYPFFTGEVFGTNRLINLLLHQSSNVERKLFGSNFINAQTFDTRQPGYRYGKSSFFNLRRWFESIF
jgi:hypothetical protein